MENNESIPSQYKVLSPWAYFGYNLLFALPLAGFICAIVFAFDNSNLNRRNYARSYFCGLLIGVVILIVIIAIVVLGLGVFTYNSGASSMLGTSSRIY